MRAGFIGLLCFTVVGVANAGSFRIPAAQEIDAAVEAVLERQKGVGVSLAVLKDGVSLHIKGYGVADLEHGVPVLPETVFQSASLGKMFTAAGIMILRREGRLDLDDPLTTYFPDGPEFWGRVKLRHLLSHRGGIRAIEGPGGALEIDGSLDEQQALAEFERLMTREYAADEYAKLIGQADMEFEPGSDFKYSNEGYVLLGLIIRKVTGSFYGDFLQERIFGPLGMATTRVNDPRAIIPNRAEGYYRVDGKLIQDEYVSRFLSSTADGSLLFSAKDLAKWEAGLVRGTILTPAEQEEMYRGASYPDGTMGPENYGYGWWSKYVRGNLVTEHSGSWQGFHTYLSRYRADGLTIAVLMNAGDSNALEIVETVAGLFNKEYAPYQVLSDQSGTEEMRKLTLAYLAGKADKSRFSESASGTLSQAQVERIKKSVEVSQDTGFELVARYTSGSQTGYGYRITNGTQRYLVTYEMNDEGEITRVLFGEE